MSELKTNEAGGDEVVFTPSTIFRLKVMGAEDGGIEYAFVCSKHEDLFPVCDVEHSLRKEEIPRQGVRPKIARVHYLRITCTVCRTSECAALRRFHTLTKL